MSGARTAGSLRGRMPRVAAFVDALRAVGWGPDVDAALRNAKAGGCVFYAVEPVHVFWEKYVSFTRSKSW